MLPAGRDTNHQLEVLYRLESVRAVTDAMLIGAWTFDPEVLAELGRLVAAAETWSRRAA